MFATGVSSGERCLSMLATASKELGAEAGGMDYPAVGMALKRFEAKAAKSSGLRQWGGRGERAIAHEGIGARRYTGGLARGFRGGGTKAIENENAVLLHSYP